MRTTFHQFFRPSKNEIHALLTTALISYDANVLLNLYRYSEETQTGLIEVLKTFADRTHLPHQVALEYARNRPKTIIDQVVLCQKAEDEFKKVRDNFILPKNKQPFLSIKSTEALDQILSELATTRKALEAMISEDPHADLLMSLFDQKIGVAPDESALKQLHAQAAERYKNKTPPGYADSKDKGVPQAYGDYIVWRQLMDLARERKQNFIFVTDETKEDWRLTHGGRTIGFRSELLDEFYRETGQRIWLLNPEGFLIATKEAGSAQVADSVIQEIAENRVAQTSALISEDKLSRPVIDEEEEETDGSASASKLTAKPTDKKTVPERKGNGEEE